MRVIVVLLMLFFGENAAAAWESVASSNILVVYVDSSTIRRSGSMVKMWYLSDYKSGQEKQGDRFLSVRIQGEFDCAGERMRNLFFTRHSRNMGNGNVVYSDDGTPGNWQPIAPGSVGESIWQSACSTASRRPAASALPLSDPDFDLVNRAALNILNIYVSPIDSNNWGDDKLPGVLNAGARFKVKLPRDGQCQYDVRVVYSDLSTETRGAQNLCALTEMVFNGTARRAAPAAKTPANPPSKPIATQGLSYGTGFFVSPFGHALTNNHVVEGCRSIDVLRDSGTQSAQIIRRDSQNDLALIRIDAQGSVPFASFRALPAIKVGEGVVVAGFPLSNILQNGLNVTLGNVSALAGLAGNASLLQITAPVQPGNSGGPLLDRTGNLVGVVVGKLDAARIAQATGDIPQNINFAVQGAVARLFLESGGLRISEKSSDIEQPMSDVSDQARSFTFQIECRR